MNVKCNACYNCINDPELGIENPAIYTMILCVKCGNKRCPHGTDHVLPCTGSNEINQTGSRYCVRINE